MTKPVPPYDFRIIVSAIDPEEESRIVREISSEFIRLGIPAVSVIVDGEHINYVNGEARNVTDIMGGLFKATPDETTGAVVRSHQSMRLN